MAPDRGSASAADGPTYQAIGADPSSQLPGAFPDPDSDNEDATPLISEPSTKFLADHTAEGQNFTVRSVLVGLGIGVIICFSNMYFGLQTGWVSGMAMPAALIGYAFFKTLANHIAYPFTPVENVLVQTVAGALGTMPLGCGFVGVLPALQFLLTPEEGGPLILGTWKLIVWSVGVCFFGVFVAVPLRKEVIIREKLKFPSGTATALMIGVLHGNPGKEKGGNSTETVRRRSINMLRPSGTEESAQHRSTSAVSATLQDPVRAVDHRNDWKARIRALVIAFAVSGFYTVLAYFIPQLHDLPVFGTFLASQWLWTLNPSPAYIGQGIIMGPATTMHMLLGAVIGWGVLSPLSKSKGWAPGPVDDWETGSKGWIVWISLAIMLADSVVSLGWLVLRPLIYHGPEYAREFRGRFQEILQFGFSKGKYAPLEGSGRANPLPSLSRDPSQQQMPLDSSAPTVPKGKELSEPDAPPEHLIGNRVVYFGLLFSIIICIVSIHIVFTDLIPLYATIIAVLVSLLLSIMGVRALGETDLNPVSGISKLTQLVFALIIPSSNPNAITINLLAGAISESAALQAGDMMQDLKTGHLLGAAPNAQFYGQLIGSFVGAVISALVYKLYTSVYEIPGGLFQVPTGYVWIFTARLVTGKGLPPMAGLWALGAGSLFIVLTAARIKGQGKWWQAYIPGGIAVAVGMYNVPSFTLARTVGGLGSLWWSWRGGQEGSVVVLASGLILGEGVFSIVNLVLASLKIPHL